MKIRILDNALRLRLSQSEVNQLYQSKNVQCSIQFSPLIKLGYSVYSLEEQKEITATLEDKEIKVLIPKSIVSAWANSNQVGISNTVKINEQTILKILIEKDFKCLSVREGEDESDLFPNPDEKHLPC